jgi:hypothetical protein
MPSQLQPGEVAAPVTSVGKKPRATAAKFTPTFPGGKPKAQVGNPTVVAQLKKLQQYVDKLKKENLFLKKKNEELTDRLVVSVF